MHLLRHYARISLGSVAFSAFGPVQRKHVTDLIEDRLAKDISLDDLADAASRSPVHFARQVKAEFGAPPMPV